MSTVEAPLSKATALHSNGNSRVIINADLQKLILQLSGQEYELLRSNILAQGLPRPGGVKNQHFVF